TFRTPSQPAAETARSTGRCARWPNGNICKPSSCRYAPRNDVLVLPKVREPLHQAAQGLSVELFARVVGADSSVESVVTRMAHRDGGSVAGFLADASDTATANVGEHNRFRAAADSGQAQVTALAGCELAE